MELTDKIIMEDALYSAKFFLQMGIGILVVAIIVGVLLAKFNKIDAKTICFLVFVGLIGAVATFFGVVQRKNLDDYYVMETKVVDKKHETHRKKSNEGSPGPSEMRDEYHVYFENNFLPDDSSSGYGEAEIGDHVYIAYSEKSGFVRYYYGNSYKYTGDKLK